MRVLVADDDTVTRRMLEKVLTSWNYNVDTASSGRTALHILQSDTPPNLALIDWNIPDKDGIEIIKEIRAGQQNEYIYAILLTGKDTKDDLLRGMEAGADDYITKPFDPQELEVRLRAASRIIMQQKQITETVRQEMHIATRIQKRLLFGKAGALLPWIDSAVFARPAQEVGGDFYDFFGCSKTSIDILLGDVMGKGVSAALLGAGAKAEILRTINTHIESHSSTYQPDTLMTSVNAQLTPELIELESFITACYMRLDCKTATASLVNAGHMPVIHYNSETGKCTSITSDNVPLGFLEDEVYNTQLIPVHEGDYFIIYSDGLTETESPEGTLFGIERLAATVEKSHVVTAQEMLDSIISAARTFSDTRPARDDITCIAVRINSLHH